jgi:hypothetical protein
MVRFSTSMDSLGRIVFASTRNGVQVEEPEYTLDRPFLALGVRNVKRREDDLLLLVTSCSLGSGEEDVGGGE